MGTEGGEGRSKMKEKVRFLVSLFQSKSPQKIPSACKSICRALVQSRRWKDQWRRDLLLWWPQRVSWQNDPYTASFAQAFLYIMENSLQPQQIFDSLCSSEEGFYGLAWVIIYSLDCQPRDRPAMDLFWSLCTQKEGGSAEQSDCFYLRLSRVTTQMACGERGPLSAEDCALLHSVIQRWKIRCQQELCDEFRSLLRSQSAWLSWIQEHDSNPIRTLVESHGHLEDSWALHYLCRLIEKENEWQQWMLSFSQSLQLQCLTLFPLPASLVQTVLCHVFQQSDSLELGQLIHSHPTVFYRYLDALSWHSLRTSSHQDHSFLSVMLSDYQSKKDSDTKLRSTLQDLTRLLETEQGVSLLSQLFSTRMDSTQSISTQSLSHSDSKKEMRLTAEELGASWIYFRDQINKNCSLSSFLFTNQYPSSDLVLSTECQLRSHLERLLQVITNERLCFGGEVVMYAIILHVLSRAWRIIRMDDQMVEHDSSCHSSMVLALQCVQAMIRLHDAMEPSYQSTKCMDTLDTIDCFLCVFLLSADEVPADELYSSLQLIAEVTSNLVSLKDPRASTQTGYLKRSSILACLILQSLPGDDVPREITFAAGTSSEEVIVYPIHLNRTAPWEPSVKSQFMESLGRRVWNILSGIVCSTGYQEEIMNIVSEKLEAFESYKTHLFSSFHPPLLRHLYEGRKHINDMPEEFQSLYHFVMLLAHKLDELATIHERREMHIVLHKRLLRLLGELAYLESPVYVFLSIDLFPRLLHAMQRDREDGVRENAAINVSVIFSTLMADPLNTCAEATEDEWNQLRRTVVRKLLTVCIDQHIPAKLMNQGLNQRTENSRRLNAHCLEALHALSLPVPSSCQEQQNIILAGMADESVGLIPTFRVNNFSYESLFVPESEPGRFLLSLIATMMDRGLLIPTTIVETLDHILQVSESEQYTSLLEVLALIQKCVEQKSFWTLLKRKNIHRTLLTLSQRIPAELTVQRDHCLRLGRKITAL